MSFTDQVAWTATAEDCSFPWGGGKNGKYFRCGLCGHKFTPGDTVRYVDAPPSKYDITSNISFVCEECDGTNGEVISAWVTLNNEYKNDTKDKYWKFFKRR